MLTALVVDWRMEAVSGMNSLQGLHLHVRKLTDVD